VRRRKEHGRWWLTMAMALRCTSVTGVGSYSTGDIR
jgi:hypothetical protein